MPEDEKKKKKVSPTVKERIQYNTYARKALRSGEDVEDMNVWVAKLRAEKKK